MKHVIPSRTFLHQLPGPKKGTRKEEVKLAIERLEAGGATVAPAKYVIFNDGAVYIFQNDETLVDYVDKGWRQETNG